MRISRVALLCSVLAVTFGNPVWSHEFTIGELVIDHPWARETAPRQANGAGYFVVANPTSTADRLIRADAAVAERVELHTHIMEDGVMKMREVEFIEVPAEGEARLEPGGFHIMLLGLEAPLTEGESFPLTLEFENAGEVEVEVAIEDVAGPAEGHGDHAGH